jgi:diguanylate cyclase (GGDEF)-like protein
MAVPSLPRAQIVTDLTRKQRPTKPKSGGHRASAAAVENWDSLFRLIMARLRVTVGEHDAVPSTSPEGKALRRVQTSVLECLSALGQIYEVLAHEKRRRHQLEQEVFEARTAVARVCDEIARAQIAAKRVRHRALHDGLTLLPNGGYFRARLEQALGRGEPPHQALAVLYLSLNLQDFKQSIDTNGHDTGDELLKMIAGRVAVAARAEDMLSRLGNDEFACLVPGLPKRDELIDFANKLLGVVSAPIKIGLFQFCLRPSIGIAIYPRDGTSAEALLTNAEFAMYRAKQHDTGYAFVDDR